MRFLLALPLPLLLILCSITVFSPLQLQRPWTKIRRFHRSATDSFESGTNKTVDYDNLSPDEVSSQLNPAKEGAKNAKIEMENAQNAVTDKEKEIVEAKNDYDEKKKEWEKWKELDDWKETSKIAGRNISLLNEEVKDLNISISDDEEKIKPYLEAVVKAKKELEELNNIDNLIDSAKTEADEWKKKVDTQDGIVSGLYTIMTQQEDAYGIANSSKATYEKDYTTFSCENSGNEKCPDIIEKMNKYKTEEKDLKPIWDEAIINHAKAKEYRKKLNSNKIIADENLSDLERKKRKFDANLKKANEDLNESTSLLSEKEKPINDTKILMEKAQNDLKFAIAAKEEADRKIAKAPSDANEKYSSSFAYQNDAGKKLSKLEGELKNLRGVFEEKQKILNEKEAQVAALQHQIDKRKVSKGGTNIAAIVAPIGAVILILVLTVVVVLVFKKRKAKNRVDDGSHLEGSSKPQTKISRLIKGHYFGKRSSRSDQSSKQSSNQPGSKSREEKYAKLRTQDLALPVRPALVMVGTADDKKSIKQVNPQISKEMMEIINIKFDRTRNEKIIMYDRGVTFPVKPFGLLYVENDLQTKQRRFAHTDFKIAGKWMHGEKLEVFRKNIKDEPATTAENRLVMRPYKDMFAVFFVMDRPIDFKKADRMKAGSDGIHVGSWFKNWMPFASCCSDEETYPSLRDGYYERLRAERARAGEEEPAEPEEDVELTQKTGTTTGTSGAVCVTQDDQGTTARIPTEKADEGEVGSSLFMVPVIPDGPKACEEEERLSEATACDWQPGEEIPPAAQDRDSDRKQKPGAAITQISLKTITRMSIPTKLQNVVRKSYTPEQKQELDNMLLTLCKSVLTYQDFQLSHREVCDILTLMMPLFENENRMVELDTATVFTDIHGDLKKAVQMLATYSQGEEPPWKFRNFLFCGDYVDRGKYSLQTILLLFLLKLRHPKSIKLLRGNHEDPRVNKIYGFHKEIYDTFGREGEGLKQSNEIIALFNEVFARMPLCALIDTKVFCAHGGIVDGIPPGKLKEEINKIPRVLYDPMSHPLACQLLWNDPIEGLTEFVPNPWRNNMGKGFGEPNVVAFCHDQNLAMIVRGHLHQHNGFAFFAGELLVTVFSCPGYLNYGNIGAAIDIMPYRWYSIRLFFLVKREKRSEDEDDDDSKKEEERRQAKNHARELDYRAKFERCCNVPGYNNKEEYEKKKTELAAAEAEAKAKKTKAKAKAGKKGGTKKRESWRNEEEDRDVSVTVPEEEPVNADPEIAIAATPSMRVVPSR